MKRTSKIILWLLACVFVLFAILFVAPAGEKQSDNVAIEPVEYVYAIEETVDTIDDEPAVEPLQESVREFSSPYYEGIAIIVADQKQLDAIRMWRNVKKDAPQYVKVTSVGDCDLGAIVIESGRSLLINLSGNSDSQVRKVLLAYGGEPTITISLKSMGDVSVNF